MLSSKIRLALADRIFYFPFPSISALSRIIYEDVFQQPHLPYAKGRNKIC
jgi:hypothetical protein